MKIQVLMDNYTYIDQYYMGEPAAAYYIEADGLRILLDTGYSDAFIKNAKKMGIDLNCLTHVVLSHGHNDHTGGLPCLLSQYDLSGTQLIAHPDCFVPRKKDGQDIGSPITLEELERKMPVSLSTKPMWLSPDCAFLGEIPVRMDYETRLKIGSRVGPDGETDDYVTEDSAIAFRTRDGLFIVTGCSHSGICNVIEQAKAVFDERRIIGVIGGFHLLKDDERADETIKYLEKERIKYLCPCHCVSFKVKAKMNDRMDIKDIGVGLELNID